MKRREFINFTIASTLISPLLANGFPGSPLMDLLPSLIPNEVGEAGKWFMNEPTRIGWFLLRYSDAQQSAEDFVSQAAEAKMNLLCITAGGSFAFYPSQIPYHQWAPGITNENDFFGKIVKEAKEKKIRIGARFDFSKQSPEAVKAQPDWFFTYADGSHPVDASGRTPPCINGDFFRKQAVLIMQEVVDRYNPSLVYLNNFGNNLGGQNLTDPCQCANCKKSFYQKTGKSLPKKMTDEVRKFIKLSTYETGKIFYEAIQRLAPHIIFINADTTPTHGWHSETRMVISPSHLWLYIASEAVNRQRNSYPNSVTCNNVTSYSSNASRLVLMPEQETRLRLYQAMAQGSPPTYVLTGTLQQEDERDTNAALQVFKWHADNEDIFGNTINPAKVVIVTRPEVAPRGRNLVAQQSLRGIYRILTEMHVPVVVVETMDVINQHPGKFDVVIVTPGAPSNGLEGYVKQGGRVIYIGEEPQFAIPDKIKQHDLTNVAYVEVRNKDLFPSLTGIRYLLATSMSPYTIIDIFSKTEVTSMPFIEYPAEAEPGLSFVAPMIENPAEVSQSNLQHTNIPAVLLRDYGTGKIAYLPWDLGALYDRMAIPAHARLFSDLFYNMTGDNEQFITNAHSSVEVALAYQESTKRLMVHCINLSGQTQNNYMDAVPMHNIKISLQAKYSSAYARQLKMPLEIKYPKGRTEFVLSELNEYEVVVLEV